MKTVNDPSIEEPLPPNTGEVIHLHFFPPHFLAVPGQGSQLGGWYIWEEEGGPGLGLRICRQEGWKEGEGCFEEDLNNQTKGGWPLSGNWPSMGGFEPGNVNVVEVLLTE